MQSAHCRIDDSVLMKHSSLNVNGDWCHIALSRTSDAYRSYGELHYSDLLTIHGSPEAILSMAHEHGYWPLDVKAGTDWCSCSYPHTPVISR